MNWRLRTGLPRARKCRGSAIVEFGIGSGVLLAAFAGVFEIGYTLLEYNKLVTAVAEGARYASIIPYDSSDTTPTATFYTAVQNMVVYGNPTGGTSPVVGGLTTANVQLTVALTNGVPGSVTVSINGFSIYAVFGRFTLTNKPRVTYPYCGVWAPA